MANAVKKYDDSNSPSFLFEDERGLPQVVSQNEISRLRQEAMKSEEGIARLLLHPSLECSLHAMLIFEIKKNRKRKIKCHNTKHKVYQMIEGEMTVELYSMKGELLNSMDLNKDSMILFLKPSTFHLNFPKSQFVLFVEYIDGPYSPGESDRRYLES